MNERERLHEPEQHALRTAGGGGDSTESLRAAARDLRDHARSILGDSLSTNSRTFLSQNRQLGGQ